MKDHDQRRNALLSSYPFLRGEMLDVCTERLSPDEESPTPDAVEEAFHLVVRDIVIANCPDLMPWQTREVIARLLQESHANGTNCFIEPNKLDEWRQRLARLPLSSDDV
ncbi:MAG: hypothetical protein GY854_29045, partial [Deltaproteobacteria bacterium]|nr:hypothetical protein [Deltaproteobacteria bacterium]